MTPVVTQHDHHTPEMCTIVVRLQYCAVPTLYTCVSHVHVIHMFTVMISGHGYHKLVNLLTCQTSVVNV